MQTFELREKKTERHAKGEKSESETKNTRTIE